MTSAILLHTWQVGDHMPDIYDAVIRATTAYHTAEPLSYIDYSCLRPRGAAVKSTVGVASGPVSFMHVLRASLAPIRRGRRYAAPITVVLSVHHPDVLEFVQDAKELEKGGHLRCALKLSSEMLELVQFALAGPYPTFNLVLRSPADEERSLLPVGELVAALSSAWQWNASALRGLKGQLDSGIDQAYLFADGTFDY